MTIIADSAITDMSTLNRYVKEAATMMLRRMERTEAVDPFGWLLEKIGAAPPLPASFDDDEASWAKHSEMIDVMFKRVCSYLIDSGELVEAFMHALPKSLDVLRPKQPDARLVDAIQTIFLRPQARYMLDELSALFSESLADRAACLSGLDVHADRIGEGISWCDAGDAVLAEYPASVVEDALGEDADRVLPREARTEIVRLRLPVHVVDDLKRKAQEYGYERDDIAAVIENQYGEGVSLSGDPAP